MKEYLEILQEFQPALKLFAFICLIMWGFLKGVREVIATGSEFLIFWDKVKPKKRNKQLINNEENAHQNSDL